ncbi:glycerol-3-phosphate 1-O-acyltransferase PlsY [Halorhodospira halophila]|uniref:Glycerol-3-phosphate acyltransferase n=1 Tax=Halorhodospira halophila (strain DSM 244 / SL1) TaxID=349124 RepID=PLSY_HALHL|nr:glycerol-3-phosphate 1-O-acyltransferase PlsY [Halorhodospira halophila]A1WZI0.1 RecName: Full=Glycerol-3-phosphate acyltransferase; AltName: Full=Acyl-PO4 G3P acyltransferase; AltName: Full=Acyl-phosphate--glycerol-3-phosphate acyltransferase; AltName: Full=G3P acyltransferase; Short=GPAT; AltName: Full=Lysophosphatidic acid synthase; Short=LPA synthase [Halorhodospira halophila SL1]ABM63092.1 acyl-phosphate glycerol-3-phosphate acyltransferase [Halorhodospira halophila SL1]MBK1727786.1 acyl
MLDVILVIIGYLIGSISSAIVVCRAMNLGDPRQGGSGNPGATNVLRLAGKVPAGITLLGDWLKGTLPVLLAWLATEDPVVASAAGLAAFFGHLFPVYFRFQGGKGVATGLGVILAWSPLALLATVVTWLAVAGAFRYSSLAAVVAFAMAPIYMLWLSASPVLTAATAILTAAIVWRHRENIVRLAAGEESRIGSSGS